jgi:hypothetical protein
VRLFRGLQVAAVAVALASGAWAGQAVDPALHELKWIAGDWRGKLGESLIEEVWDQPAGRSMVGHFRAVEGGSPKFYELLALELAQEGVVMRLRHFGPGLSAWEKDQALTFRMIEKGHRRAVFEDSSQTPPERLTYERHGDRLLIRLEKMKAGKPSTTDFWFHRH